MGLDEMRTRLSFQGYNQDQRNVNSKYRSFTSALKNSYQAEDIILDNGTNKVWRCLINSDKLTENYDQKILSIGFDAGIQPGDTFYWRRTNSHWIVLLQEFSEEAYFRGSIRKCNYKIGNDWIYLRGPVETAIIWRQKHQIEMNDLNYSILFYIKKTEENLEKFSRFNIIKFEGHNWRVATTDKFSQPGIIEVYLEEYYDNEAEDHVIPIEIVEPDPKRAHIEGPQIVKPWDTNLVYTIVGRNDGEFVIDSKKVEVITSGANKCILNITTGKSGSFTIYYKVDEDSNNDLSLDVTISSF